MFCPKCGNQVPDDAMFCGKCGHQFAARNVAQPARMNVQPTYGNAGGFSFVQSGDATMPIARAIMGIVVFIMLFLQWLKYNVYGISGGFSFIEICDMGDYAFQKVAMIVGVVMVLIGAVAEFLAKMNWGRWASLAGAVIVFAVTLWLIIECYTNGDIGTSGYASIGFTFAPWITLILSVLTGVSCFIKR